MGLTVSGAFAQITELIVTSSNSTNGVIYNSQYDIGAKTDLSWASNKIAANRNFSAELAVRQQAYTRDPAYATLLKYSVGF